MASGGVVALGVAESLQGRELDPVLSGRVVGPIAAVADLSAGRRKERLGRLDALRAGEGRGVSPE